jgi:hypothetical protein
MRVTFEPQLKLGQLVIADTPISKSRDGMSNLVFSLRTLYCTLEFRDRIQKILEDSYSDKAIMKNGRPGMPLWQVFVLSQIRLCTNCSYDQLMDYANQNKVIRQLMGIEMKAGFENENALYNRQTIYDNMLILSDDTMMQINEVLVDFGHKIFKKKSSTPLNLKTDSFVVESDVHFPTDYNLLWDCVRKGLDIIGILLKTTPDLSGWRNIASWYRTLKILMREVGKISSSKGKNKDTQLKEKVTEYLDKARKLMVKFEESLLELAVNGTNPKWNRIEQLEYFVKYQAFHIDLLERRIINGEQIPSSDKIYSVFEPWTEWLSKGKRNPSVELGKNLAITTDQFNLIVDYQIMDHITDSEIVISLADRLLLRYKEINSWSFDKGFWNGDNKYILQLEIAEVVLPKKGKCNKTEFSDEHRTKFKHLRNLHSTVESNINQLETRGLDRCPDRGYDHFKRYVGMAVCVYNLCSIGRELKKQAKEKCLKVA